MSIQLTPDSKKYLTSVCRRLIIPLLILFGIVSSFA
jgi:hypothetical protein